MKIALTATEKPNPRSLSVDITQSGNTFEVLYLPGNAPISVSSAA